LPALFALCTFAACLKANSELRDQECKHMA